MLTALPNFNESAGLRVEATVADTNVAKAITLALAMKSMEQKRDCYLITFSTTIETRDLAKCRSLPELFDFLQSSFHGGTDAARQEFRCRMAVRSGHHGDC